MPAASDAPPPAAEVLRPTTFLEPARLSTRLGIRVVLATESFQHTGSFKFRAAYNVAARVAQARLITASSGNFGQALAYACRLLGKTCSVVMPETSARVKIEAVREYGGMVDLIDLRKISRSARVMELAGQDPGAYVASAYDDPLVIEGNATLGVELAAASHRFDSILSPIGGGGLTSGLILGLEKAGCRTPVFGVEPVLANDFARSFRAGRILPNEAEPDTIADGVRSLSVGQHNWPILRGGLQDVIEVTEDQIREAVRLLFALANLKVEPTGALGVAALLARPEAFRQRRACCVISGGNVDPGVFAKIIKD